MKNDNITQAKIDNIAVQLLNTLLNFQATHVMEKHLTNHKYKKKRMFSFSDC